ncbi:MAG: DNA adenine methylase [Thermomicrobiales bacterium]|nr:DNA adenine methylase [Thermomicrobiales bacterium]
MLEQTTLWGTEQTRRVAPIRQGLLKWVGSKQKTAVPIVDAFPSRFGTYFEPFLGSGAVLGNLAPQSAVASDVFAPLMEIWITLSKDPDMLKAWYADRWQMMMTGDKVEVYEQIKASYNENPNGADFLFLCRACYGGIVRFRKRDGYMSTPCGIHSPIPPQNFAKRVDLWVRRTRGTVFRLADYREVFEDARSGDLIYCDPPYSYSQSILYGAQDFSMSQLMAEIGRCKDRGVFVALSIDGHKESGNYTFELETPAGLFERELMLTVGRSMLKRFQNPGVSMDGEVIADRLLLTY